MGTFLSTPLFLKAQRYKEATASSSRLVNKSFKVLANPRGGIWDLENPWSNDAAPQVSGTPQAGGAPLLFSLHGG